MGIFFKKNNKIFIWFILSLIDLISFAIANVLAYISSFFLSGQIFENSYQYVDFMKITKERTLIFLIIIIFVYIWLFFKGHYNSRSPFWEEFKDVIVVSIFGLFLEGFSYYLLRSEISRLSIIQTWVFFPIICMSLRLFSKKFLYKLGIWEERVIVFGKNDIVDYILAEKYLGYKIVGKYDILNIEKSMELIESYSAGTVVISVGKEEDNEKISKLSYELSYRNIPTIVIPFLEGLPVSGMEVQYAIGVEGIMLIDKTSIPPFIKSFGKRFFDILLSLIGIFLLIVPMLIISMIIFFIDGGNIIYAHKRIGYKGKEFKCFKFRSMRTNSEKIFQEYLEKNKEEKEYWLKERKIKNDPRITKIGKIIRKTALDELPQLFNVLFGDMSLIGPRPITNEELDLYEENKKLYLSVKPGLTGLWQISGRNDISYKQRVLLDAWYVRNWSPWHDIIILIKTIPVLLFRKGAY